VLVRKIVGQEELWCGGPTASSSLNDTARESTVGVEVNLASSVGELVSHNVFVESRVVVASFEGGDTRGAQCSGVDERHEEREEDGDGGELHVDGLVEGIEVESLKR
jgi:hypothetical protein